MEFEIARIEAFDDDLGRAPKPVKNAMRRIYRELRNHPEQSQPPRTKRLSGYKGLWRLRVNDDYRLVYRMERNAKPPTITLLMLGHRDGIYDRLGSESDGTPGIRVIASEVADLLEREPTPEEVGKALHAVSLSGAPDSNPDAPLPVELTTELLDEWGIPAKYHDRLAGIRTEGQLISADAPGHVIERVMNALWPKPIEKAVQEPVRIVPNEQALLAASENPDLVTLLLKLDPEQEGFVSRFRRADPQGPWLLKGGPGSGKSVVALYCIKALIDEESAKLPGQRRRLRILLSTYTNSLVNAARHLNRSLNTEHREHTIDVLTVDKVASRFRSSQSLKPVSTNDGRLRNAGNTAVASCKREIRQFVFGPRDVEYLLDEVEWVIVGQDLRTLDDYLNQADRAGRRRALGRRQRAHVWGFYERLRSEMTKRQLCLWVDIEREALENAKAKYDYVFIDEAQDLKPVAIRFLQRLAKKPESLFLTADSNQSIYGTGMSWARVADDVKFSGRAQILKRNYRTTKEIWSAISSLGLGDEDPETLSVEPVFSGPPPVLVRYTDSNWGDRLNQFLYEALREERLGADSAAVLVPWKEHFSEVIKRIDPKLNPKAFETKDMDITHAGVKVITMHGAKGLEFPVVAIWGANAGVLPSQANSGDPEEHRSRQQRLLFVAATRAMRQLIIFTRNDNPSEFLSRASGDLWEIEQD